MALDSQGKEIKKGCWVKAIMAKSGYPRYGKVVGLSEENVQVKADGNAKPYLVPSQNVTVIEQPCLRNWLEFS